MVTFYLNNLGVRVQLYNVSPSERERLQLVKFIFAAEKQKLPIFLKQLYLMKKNKNKNILCILIKKIKQTRLNCILSFFIYSVRLRSKFYPDLQFTQ